MKFLIIITFRNIYKIFQTCGIQLCGDIKVQQSDALYLCHKINLSLSLNPFRLNISNVIFMEKNLYFHIQYHFIFLRRLKISYSRVTQQLWWASIYADYFFLCSARNYIMLRPTAMLLCKYIPNILFSCCMSYLSNESCCTGTFPIWIT